MDSFSRVLAAARVRNVLLGSRRADRPVAAVERLLAVQAQEHAFSRWAVAQRTARPEEGAVLSALESGEIVRVHALRPTWHYVAGADLRWVQALTGGRVRKMNAGWYRNHGIDEAFLARARDLVEKELSGGSAKTRDELKDALSAAGVDVAGQRMAAVLMDLELAAVVCSGPVRGRHHTYMLVEERLPPAKGPSAEEATAELVRRYLSGHAPATLKDLRWWSTLTLAQLRRAVDDLGDAVVAEKVDGVEYLWLSADPPHDDDGHSPRFQLLQVFDELFVGYSESRGLLDPDGEFGAVLPIGYTRMMHVVLEGDRLAGRWRSDRNGDEMKLTFELGRPMTADDRAELERAAVDHGAFLGRVAVVDVLGESTR